MTQVAGRQTGPLEHAGRPLPDPPDEDEKYGYLRRRLGVLIPFGALSFGGLAVTQWRFVQADPLLWLFAPLLAAGAAGFVVSLVLDLFTRDFDLKAHRALAVGGGAGTPTVDIFLPVCGEPLPMLRNTWIHVRALVEAYPGQAIPFVLDDSGSRAVEELALEFGFRYGSRPDRGRHRKAGNLRFGFAHSHGEFVLLLDADFAPRPDFLAETLPWLLAEPRTAIVQTPQFFRAEGHQNWLERGAGAVQEIFYRSVQVSRQRGGGSVCCGSCAVYRRTALAEIGGCSLAEHSEDMHTGLDLRLRGWDLRYIPLVLSAGVCPDSTHAFLGQQFRWSLASFELVGGARFWRSRMSWRMRLSYLAGALYYLHTALLPVWAPLIPLAILLYLPQTLTASGAFWLLPSLVFGGVVLPLWHRCPFRLEAFAVRLLCCWAHVFALAAFVSGRRLRWRPSGVDGNVSRMRRVVWRAAAGWSVSTAVAFLAAALWRFSTMDRAASAVLLGLALFDVLVSGRMVLQPRRPAE
ncbi:hypothetical protein GCM10027589_08100 [Actinocorallia lasiicapitis]